MSLMPLWIRVESDCGVDWRNRDHKCGLMFAAKENIKPASTTFGKKEWFVSVLEKGMILMKKSFLTLTMFGFLFIFSTTVNANTSIELKTDNFKINNAEIFDVTLYAKEEGISAGDFNIFFDKDKLEYI